MDGSDREGCAISDVLVVNGDSAICLDWKTGARRDKRGKLKEISNDQLVINFIVAALWYPEIKKFTGRYIYVGEQDPAHRTPGLELTRAELVPQMKDLMGKIKNIKDSMESGVWQKRTSGLCRNYCGVADCPHCG